MGNENPYADLEKKQDEYIAKQNDYLAQQSKIQQDQVQANTDFVINEIERQKAYAEQDLAKEGKSAYVDYQKSLNPYGVEAEARASQGLGKSGYSESSQTRNFNAYQNRVSVAKQTTMRIKADFDNKINEAKLTGNTEKAKIALQEYKQRMELLQQELGFYTDMMDRKTAYKQWQTEFEYTKLRDAQEQANWEKSFAYQQEQDRQAQANWEKEFARINRSSGGSSSRSSGLTITDGAVVNGGNTAKTSPPVKMISNDTIGIQQPNGEWATLTITPGANNNTILNWGKKFGVDLSPYLK